MRHARFNLYESIGRNVRSAVTRWIREQEETGDDEYLSSYGYQLESLINGNFSQVRNTISGYGKRELVEFVLFLQENGGEKFVNWVVRNCQ